MTAHDLPRRFSARAVLPLLLGGIAFAFARDAATLFAHRAQLDPSGWLGLGCSVAVGATTAWLAVTVLFCALAELPGRGGTLAEAIARRLAPRVVRRALALTLLTSAVAPTAAQAFSAPETSPTRPAAMLIDPARAVRPSAGGNAASDGGDLPDPRLRPDGASGSATDRDGQRSDLPGPGGTPRPAVVVRPGDTLWDLAGTELGGNATIPRVAGAWPRWFEVNRAVVADPDLIYPGQVLTVPPAAPVATPDAP